MATVVQPAVDELRRREIPYVGTLYAGLALTSKGVRVVEFNARFGDPETQVVLDRLATALAKLLQSCAIGGLDPDFRPEWHPGAAVTVVVAAEGYPEAPVKGDEITGLDEASKVDGAYVLHAGTKLGGEGRLIANGGRVLNVVGTGPDLPPPARPPTRPPPTSRCAVRTTAPTSLSRPPPRRDGTGAETWDNGRVIGRYTPEMGRVWSAHK